MTPIFSAWRCRRIQASLHIAENQIGPTISYFRLAVFAAVLICSAADLVGRRRLLLVTVFGQAIFTLASAFAATYPQFVWAQILTRVFAYTEEMLCFVVIAEEMAAAARGWAAGTIASLNFFGAGLASLAFVAINVLPYGWRSLYVIGALPLFLLGYLRKGLPETERFVALAALEKTKSKWAETGLLLKEMVTQFPGRLLLILIASAGFGFGVFPGAALAPKYLQSVMHYSPDRNESAVHSWRFGRPGTGDHGRTPVGPHRPQGHGLCRGADRGRGFRAVLRQDACRFVATASGSWAFSAMSAARR